MEVSEFIDKIHAYEMNGVLENFFTRGYCYYFAVMLQERFGGEIVYDPIDGHFFFKKDNWYYDYYGTYGDYGETAHRFITKDEWITSKPIVEGCILKVQSELN